ncbi:MAG: MFS transporter, partial [Planctomycetales bacterium]|nr:MFS transporter [Planctomycetales bacterium]
MQEYQGKEAKRSHAAVPSPDGPPPPANLSPSADLSRSVRKASVNRRAWAPLSIPAYRTFWIAGLFSNMGTWMHETGAQWLMTSLDPSPSMVSAVRTAMTIPVFCLALPAGVWADRFDRRTW